MKIHSSMKVVPAAGIVLVTPLEEEIVGVIRVSDSMKEKDLAGLVVSVGGPVMTHYGAILNPPDVKKGDIIIHTSQYTAAYNHAGKRLRFIKFDDIQGVIRHE